MNLYATPPAFMYRLSLTFYLCAKRCTPLAPQGRYLWACQMLQGFFLFVHPRNSTRLQDIFYGPCVSQLNHSPTFAGSIHVSSSMASVDGPCIRR